MADKKIENLEVKNFVIHQLLKDAGTRIVKEKKASKLISIGEKERIFLYNLDKTYHKKSNPIYGIFADENPHFKNELIKYSSNDNDFYHFTVSVMNHYKQILHNTPAATGGYMIICEYTNKLTSKDLMLVLMINNKEGYVVNEENLTLEDIKNLDLTKVDVACLINLTEWKNIEKNIQTDRQTYLSFVKGMKQVSFYFMSFLDVDNKRTSTESTNTLIKAFEDFSTYKSWDRDTKIKKRNEVFSYCNRCMNVKEEILLTKISEIIDPDNPEDFEDFSTEDDRRVSAVISGDRNKMKILKYLAYSDEKLKIEFDSSLLLNKTIHFDEKSNKLTIKNVPQELVDKIKKLG